MTRSRILVSSFAALLLVAAHASDAVAEPREIVDGAGRTVTIDDTSRVVSLGGSVTEIVYALGLEDRIAAVDVTSLYPPRAMQEKPNVGYLRALSAEGVLSVGPSLVLAEEDAGPATAVAQLEDASVPFLLSPGAPTPEGVVEKIRFVGEVMGAGEKADAMADAVAADFATLASVLGPVDAPVKALFVLSVADGRILAAGGGTTADAMLRLAGARDVFDNAFEGYKPVGKEAILTAAPEAIVVMARHGAEKGPGVAVADILADPVLAETPAGKAKRVVAMDGLYLLGFGPRAAHAARDLAAALYPDRAIPALPARPWTQPAVVGQ